MKVIVTLKVVSYWVLHSSQFHVFFSFHLNCFHLKFKNFELNNMVYGVKPALIITYRNFCSGYILGTIACNGNGHECNCINKFRRCRRNLIIIFQSNSTFAFRLLVTYICLVSTTRHWTLELSILCVFFCDQENHRWPSKSFYYCSDYNSDNINNSRICSETKKNTKDNLSSISLEVKILQLLTYPHGLLFVVWN